MKVSTIGFTQKSAEQFFGGLQRAGVRRVVDVRLHNTSQLAGFAKRDDLRYFLSLLGIDYVQEPLLAPTEELLADYQKKRIDWVEYERRFTELLRGRRIEQAIQPTLLDQACLLCSEAQPQRCHRRLVAEHLQRHWGDLEIEHLV